MMAQPQVRDHRDEVLAASRHRSGSTVMSHAAEGEPLPPASPPPQPPTLPPSQTSFLNLKTKFEDPSQQGSSRSRFGSKVNRIKEMFQGGGSGGGGGGVGVRTGTADSHHTSSSSSILSAPSSTSVSDNDRSPELKRKRIGDAALSGSRDSLSAFHPRPLPSSAAVSLSAPDLLPQHPDPNLMEATSHVQRFNYTRMLFAKMEEESRLAQEREKVMRRKVSPAHTPSSPPPVLSPRSPPPMSPTRKVSSHDDVSRLSEEMVEQCFSERGRRDSGYRAGAHKDAAAREPALQQHEEPAIKPATSSHVSSRPGAHHSSVSSTTVTLHSQPDLIGDNVPGDRMGRYIPSFDLIKAAESIDKKERAGSDFHSVRARVTGGLSHQPDSKADQPPKTEHSTRRSRPPPPDSLSSSSHSSSTSKQENGVDTSVTMRPKKSAGSHDLVTSKRISKEEIEAALERADNYLSTMHPAAEAEELKSVKRRSWDVRRQREDFATKRYSLDEETSFSTRTPHHAAPPSQAHRPAAPSDVSDEIDRMPASAMDRLSQDEAGDLVGSVSDIPPPSYESSTYVHVRASRRVSPDDKPKLSKPAPPANKPSPVPRRIAPPPPPLPSKPPKGEVASAPAATPPPAPAPSLGEWEGEKETVDPTAQSPPPPENEPPPPENEPPDWGDSQVSTCFGAPQSDPSEQTLGKLLLR